MNNGTAVKASEKLWDRIRQQRHRPGGDDEDHLHDRRRRQGDERDLHRLNAALTRLRRGVHAVRSVMTVGTEHLGQRAPQAAVTIPAVGVAVTVIVTVRAVRVVVVGAVGRAGCS